MCIRSCSFTLKAYHNTLYESHSHIETFFKHLSLSVQPLQTLRYSKRDIYHHVSTTRYHLYTRVCRTKITFYNSIPIRDRSFALSHTSTYYRNKRYKSRSFCNVRVDKTKKQSCKGSFASSNGIADRCTNQKIQ